jgi:hypothetical protein
MFRGLIRALVTGPLACVALPPGLTPEGLKGNRWLAGWDAPGGPLVTLTPWSAERLGTWGEPPRPLHLVELTDRQAHAALGSALRPAAGGATAGLVQPLERWAAPGDEGPPPSEPPERAGMLHPTQWDLLEWPPREDEPDPILEEWTFATRDAKGRRPRGGGLGPAAGAPDERWVRALAMQGGAG